MAHTPITNQSTQPLKRQAPTTRGQAPQKPLWKRWGCQLGCLGSLLLLTVLFVSFAAYQSIIGSSFPGSTSAPVSPTQQTKDAQAVATDFLAQIRQGHYSAAYDDLDNTLSISFTADAFSTQALLADKCFGKVTAVNEKSGGGSGQAGATQQTFTYEIRRAALAQPYQIQLILTLDPSGNWKVSSYGPLIVPPDQQCS